MEVIVIDDRVKWNERLHWLADYASEFIDTTNWSMWTLGMESIKVYVDHETAIMYYLSWTQ